MPSTGSLLAFAGAALVLLVIPGPAVMYIVTRSAAQGRVAGLVSVVGIHVGTLAHVAAAVAGLSAILVASATAFTVVKIAGGLYLVALGVRALRAAHRLGVDPAIGPPRRQPLGRVFADGVLLNVLNPKTAMFFLSFVPQFVDERAASATGQLLVLSALFIGLGLITDGAYAVAGGWLGRRLGASPAFARRRDRVAAATYLGLGAVTVAGAAD